MVNYYKILRVSPKASNAEIKSAYRRLARKKHPDKNAGSESSAREFALIAQAYQILIDPQQRAFYDKQLLQFEFDASSKDEDSILNSDNPHARRLRRLAYEKRYNDIIDRMIAEERRESLALQKIIYPLVALFVSTCFIAIFRPAFWSRSDIIGKIILLTFFLIGVLHLFKRLQAGFTQYTYSQSNLHDSILEDLEEESKPYSRATAVSFLVIGLLTSLGIGWLIGNYLEIFIAAAMPTTILPTLKPELVFYPPIIVLIVDMMHTVASRFDY